MGRVVLVTGVAGDLGRRFARRLAEHPDIERVVGVDVTPPKLGVGRMQFVRADIRNPVIAKVMIREQVDTVVHAAVASRPAPGGSGSMKELNVIGTMQLLAACQQAPQLRHLVVRSSTAVYGASNRDPAMFVEGMNARRAPRTGFPKDVGEVESYVRGFARRRPDVRVTTLRMANMMGPIVYSPLTAYFRLPLVPTVLGFDPRLQFLHEHDAHGALERATLHDVPGTFNIAGDGVMMLSQAVRRLGKPALPLPPFAVSAFGSTVGQAKRVDFSPEQVAFLTYGRGVDNTRMRTELGYEPVYSTEQAFDDFAAGIKPGVLRADRVRAAETTLVRALSGGAG
ncbi:NAD-dependent epimerase/dehydratase family protein [Nocardioides terrisoli]|uniref:NAD-dependent epimerase/dehydratase family protein n=1 Tax=Nocardioides terrisoli TaxID=3388267 RepID=UPI00287B80AA|nr:NAD-dependent epimerase/dehydratase family protein [Nocardioides marmorisolisilvae]